MSTVGIAKNHSLRETFAKLSDLFSDLFHVGSDIQRPVITTTKVAQPLVHCHRCSAPDGVGSEGFRTAAKSGCRRSDRSFHHGCCDLDEFSIDQDMSLSKPG
jgi:hypothetical protein